MYAYGGINCIQIDIHFCCCYAQGGYYKTVSSALLKFGPDKDGDASGESER